MEISKNLKNNHKIDKRYMINKKMEHNQKILKKEWEDGQNGYKHVSKQQLKMNNLK